MAHCRRGSLAAGLLGCFALSHGAEPPEPTAPEQQVYKTVDGRELKVDVFRPAGPAPARGFPAIAFFHGGGWAYGGPEEFHPACRRYAGKGVAAFSFAYRLSIRADGKVPHPRITPIESVKDARSALRWLRTHAAALHIDPNRIAASGQSAGGQLALSTALIDKINEETDDPAVRPAPDALILYSSNVNTLEAWVDMLLGDRRGEIWSISPHHNLKAGLPPLLAFHGKDDCTVPFWVVRRFVGKAKSLGNEVELVPIEGRKHYLGDADQEYGRYFDEKVMERTDAFLAARGWIKKQ